MDAATKQQIIQLHVRGFRFNNIARQMNYNRNTISKVVNDWRKGKLEPPKRVKRGRYKKGLTAQKTYQVLDYFINHPFNTYKNCVTDLKLLVCPKTVARALTKNGLKNFIACSKPFLTMKNQLKRLKFAIKYKDWTRQQWSNLVAMDEKTVQTYANGKVMVKRRIGERYHPDKIVTAEVQNSKWKVNLVGMISCHGPNMIYSVPTELKACHFKQLMSTKIEPLIGGKTVLMDNAPIHGAGIEYLSQSGVTVLRDFPPKSGDLNPIESIWAELQKRMNKKLRNTTVSSKSDLLEMIRVSWKDIPATYIKNCMLSMPDRLKEVIKMKGRQTRF